MNKKIILIIVLFFLFSCVGKTYEEKRIGVITSIKEITRGSLHAPYSVILQIDHKDVIIILDNPSILVAGKTLYKVKSRDIISGIKKYYITKFEKE